MGIDNPAPLMEAFKKHRGKKPVDMGPAWYDAAANMEIIEAVMG